MKNKIYAEKDSNKLTHTFLKIQLCKVEFNISKID